MNYHKKMSFLKSLIRLIGYAVLVFNLSIGAVLLMLAEVIGIAEEKEE